MIKGPFRDKLEMMKVHQISDKLRWTKKNSNAFQIDPNKNKNKIDKEE